MAKKKSKKATSKAAKKPAKKNAAKSVKKRAATAKGPRAMSTGRGATPLEIGSRLVADFNAGKWELTDAWSKDLVSIEGLGVAMAWEGRRAVDEKNAWWASTHKVYGGRAEGPFVGATGFAVKFTIDVEDTTTGKRETMVEVGVYTVNNGKIIREEFMYFAG